MSPKDYVHQLPQMFRNHPFSLMGSEDDEYGGYIITHFGLAPDAEGVGPIYLVTHPGESYIVLSERIADHDWASDEELLEVVEWGLSHKLGDTPKTLEALGWPTSGDGSPVPWSTLSAEQKKSFAVAAEAETDGGMYMPDQSEEFYDVLTELFLGIYKRDANDYLLSRVEGPIVYEWSELRAFRGE